MEEELTAYLIRTLPAKPKGLKVKLKVTTVNKEVMTFDEKDNPVVTILPYGLYLAGPTPQGVKDPMLLGIMNQMNLQTEELAFELRMACSRPPAKRPEELTSKIQSELGPESQVSSSGEFVTQIVSWTKSGITKSISQRVETSSKAFKFFKELRKKPEPSLGLSSSNQQTVSSMAEEPVSTPTPAPQPAAVTDFTKAFLSIMQSLLFQYKSAMTNLASLPPKPIQEHKSMRVSQIIPLSLATPKQAARRLELDTSQLRALGSFLSQTYLSMAHYRNFLTPTAPTSRESHALLLEDATNRLLSLLSAIDDLLIQPFAAKLTQPNRVATFSEPEFFHRFKLLIQSLLAFATNPPKSNFDSGFDTNLLTIAELSENVIDVFFSIELACVDFANEYFSQLESKLEAYPWESRTIEVASLCTALLRYKEEAPNSDPFHRMSPRQRFHQIYEIFLQGNPESKLCVTRNTKSSIPSRFFGGFQTENDWKLLAVCCRGETKILLILERIPPVIEDPDDEIYFDDPFEEASYKTNTHVMVYRQDYQMASFKLDSAEGLATNFSDGQNSSKTFFTGRHFVSIPNSRYSSASAITVIDFSPCFESIPKCPISRMIDPRTQISEIDWPPLASACTDRFVSILICQPSEGLQIDHKQSPVPSIQMHFLLLDQQQLEMVGPIPEDQHPEFKLKAKGPIRMNLGSWDTEFSKNQLCWLKGSTKVFYISWLSSSPIDDNSMEEEYDIAYDLDDLKNPELEPEIRSLFVAYLEVPRALNNIKMVVCESFNLDAILKEQSIIPGMRLKFNTLTTRNKEYLVMDVMRPYRPATELGRQTQSIFVRKLLTVHKQKLHWVLVVGNQHDPFPQMIGTQITCAGYETSHMSLFHMRRVFSSDKVISAVYRLSYKAL